MVKKDHHTEIPEWVLAKIQHYCAYEERCMSDVKSKLQTFHLHDDLPEAIINKLIRDDYLNEERYARVFAGGKFRINHWGRNKIYAALLQKGLPELFILEGLNEIDEQEYIKVLKGLLSKKSKEVTESNIALRNKKLANFAISRGFEHGLVWEILNVKE
jgi:regulatory protein